MPTGWILVAMLLELASCQATAVIGAVFGSTCGIVVVVLFALLVCCCCSWTCLDYFINLL